MRLLCVLVAMAVAAPTSSRGAAERKPLVTKVEHFYLVSNEAEKLYNFFRDELRLPVVWPYTTYDDFASGGLTLGNVAMEFVTEKGDRAGTRTEFKGIAFEPAGDADAAVAELRRRRIPHGDPDVYKVTKEGRAQVGWVTIDLKKFPPVGAYIFICDYKQRDEVAGRRGRASKELAGRGGGPLGVTSVREIVVGVKSVRDASRQWGNLLDTPRRGVDTMFAFGPGPKVRLVRAGREGIQSLVVGVKSAGRAKQFLLERRMYGGENEGKVWIAPAALGGLRVALVEDRSAPLPRNRPLQPTEARAPCANCLQ